MSTVTLETLRAEFEAARDKIAPPEVMRDLFQYEPEDIVERMIKVAYEGRFNDLCWRELPDTKRDWELLVLARTYLIARDHGLEAAMLYKLSGGNIDPRKGGEA